MSLNAEDDHPGTSGLISEPARKRKKKQMQKKSTSEVARVLFSMGSNDTDSEENVIFFPDSVDDLPLDELVGEYSPKAAEDVEYLFCGERFSKSNKQELRIQCIKCNDFMQCLGNRLIYLRRLLAYSYSCSYLLLKIDDCDP